MRIVRIAAILILTAALLAGCADLTMPDRRNRLVSDVQDFTQRLRWKDVNGAAEYFEPKPGERFRRMFAETDDLQIVDVRVRRVEMPDPGKASVLFNYQYYELPSVTVRSETVEQEWVLHQRGRGLPGEWKIATDFPPRSADSGKRTFGDESR